MIPTVERTLIFYAWSTHVAGKDIGILHLVNARFGKDTGILRLVNAHCGKDTGILRLVNARCVKNTLII